MNKFSFQDVFPLLFIITLFIYQPTFPVNSFAQLDVSLQSYENGAAGIRMSYPSQWILARELGTGIQLVYPSTQQQFGNTMFSIAGYLSNMTQQQFESFDEVKTSEQYLDFVNKIFSHSFIQNSTASTLTHTTSNMSQVMGPVEIINHSKTEVDGKLSHIFEIQSKGEFTEPATMMAIYTLFNGGIYLITYVSPSNDYSQHLPTINAIISSTELLGMSKEILSSNFATFSSMFMGIKLDFPAYWVPTGSDLLNPQVLVLPIPEQFGSAKLVGDVVLQISPNYRGVTLDELPAVLEDYITTTFPPDVRDEIYWTGFETVILNSTQWYEYGFRYTTQFIDADIVVSGLITIKDNRFYDLRYQALNDKFGDFEDEFEYIKNSLALIGNPLLK